MEFKVGRGYLRIIILLSVSASAQVAEESQPVHVLIYDNARISGDLLKRAGAETRRIFRSAGIGLIWNQCTEGGAEAACRSTGQDNVLMLRVVPKGKSARESVYGDAFLAEDGTGRYADIFFDRIASAHQEAGVDESRLLGAVAAHEIGHLLLGLRAHATIGIMSPVWANDLIQKMEWGTLLFTPTEATRMRKRMEQSRAQLNLRFDRFDIPDVGQRTTVFSTPVEISLTAFLDRVSPLPTRSPRP